MKKVSPSITQLKKKNSLWFDGSDPYILFEDGSVQFWVDNKWMAQGSSNKDFVIFRRKNVKKHYEFIGWL